MTAESMMGSRIIQTLISATGNIHHESPPADKSKASDLRSKTLAFSLSALDFRLRGMFKILLALLLAVNLLCVNVASGSPLLAAWLDWRSTRGDNSAARAAVWLARASLVALIAGTALGLIVGWLKWDADYRALWLGPLSYKLKGAVIEVVFSFALILGWWLWLPGKSGGSKTATIIRSLLAVLAATNLLYHFPLLFSVAAHLQSERETSGPTINGAGFRRLID